MTIFALCAFGKIDVTMSSTSGEQVRIYYSGKTKEHSRFEDIFSTAPEERPGPALKKITFRLRNETVQALRVDPGSGPGTYTITRIVLYSFFGPPVVLDPAMDDLQVRTDPHSRLVATRERWTLVTDKEDPYLIFTGDIQTTNPYLKYLLPGVISLVFFFAIRGVRVRDFVCIRDISGKKPSSGHNLTSLDGLRGLAALLVLGHHIGWEPIHDMGPNGVVAFFCLSGFLLSMPFVKQPERVKDPLFVRNYFFRRLKRILPMFYLVVTASYLFQGNVADFVRTILFLQGNGIWWTILQEVYFYTLLPLFMFAGYFVFRGNRLWAALFFLCVAVALNGGHIKLFPVYGYDTLMKLHVGIFLCGMVMCYLYHYLASVGKPALLQKIADNHLVGIVLLTGFLGSQYLHHYLVVGLTRHQDSGWVYHGNYSVFVALFILFLTLSKKNILVRLLSLFPLRAIGVVGYSFYLLHVYGMKSAIIVCNHYLGINSPKIVIFLVATLLTYLMSAVTYTYIERPFFYRDADIPDSRTATTCSCSSG